jgi:hypothetical protein
VISLHGYFVNYSVAVLNLEIYESSLSLVLSVALSVGLAEKCSIPLSLNYFRKINPSFY